MVLHGRFSRANVHWATGRASAFVLPSRVEFVGIVVLQMMAAGLLVVVSARGGAVEIVRDGITGWLSTRSTVRRSRTLSTGCSASARSASEWLAPGRSVFAASNGRSLPAAISSSTAKSPASRR